MLSSEATKLILGGVSMSMAHHWFVVMAIVWCGPATSARIVTQPIRQVSAMRQRQMRFLASNSTN